MFHRLLTSAIALTTLAALLLGADAPTTDVSAAAKTDEVTTATLLRELVDLDSVARLPEPAYVIAMESSRDKRSVSPDKPATWFANGDNMERRENKGECPKWIEINGRRECPLLDVEGPGAVVRFWTGGWEPVGTVRVYLDGSDEPVLAGKMSELFAAKQAVPHPLANITAGNGLNLYLPIPYAKRCFITYDQAQPGKPQAPPPWRWFNIEYRTYAAGTPVRSATSAELIEAANLKVVSKRLLTPFEPAAGKDLSLTGEVQSGKELALDLPAGPSAIRHLRIRLTTGDTNALDQALRSTVLVGTFDGEETIWCPIGDLSGSGTGINLLSSWYRDVAKDGTMTLRFPMPWKRSGRLVVRNLGPVPVTLDLQARCTPWAWDDRSMHFHARWRQQREIPIRPFRDWTYVVIEGQGVYMGDTLSLNNRSIGWWGEGDEKIWRDGEKFPSIFGTGTEDYYGYAWGRTDLFQTPFCNQIRADGPYLPEPSGKKGRAGCTVLTRTRNLDRIPFSRSLKVDMEILHADVIFNKTNDNRLDYTVASYFYARPGAKTDRTPDPDEAVRPVPSRPSAPTTAPAAPKR